MKMLDRAQTVFLSGTDEIFWNFWNQIFSKSLNYDQLFEMRK